jgi:hypothetical protein
MSILKLSSLSQNTEFYTWEEREIGHDRDRKCGEEIQTCYHNLVSLMELNFILHVGFSKEIMWVRLWSWSDMMNYGGGKEVLLLPA